MWYFTPIQKQNTPEGPIETRVFERMITTPKGSFSIGSISYFKVPKSKNGTDLTAKEIAQKFKENLKLPNWNYQKQGSTEIFEVNWEIEGRYFRIYATTYANSIAYSIAFFRQSYFKDISLEVNLLQSHLAQSENIKIASKKHYADYLLTSILDRITLNAYAAPPDLSGVSDGVSVPTSVPSTIDPKDLKKLNAQLASYQKLTNKFLKEHKRTNDLIEDLSSNKKAFILGGSYAAGAVVGAFAMNLVLDGITAGGAKLYKLIKDRRGNDDIFDYLKKIRNEYNKTLEDLKTIETLLDSFSDFDRLLDELKINKEDVLDLAQIKRQLNRLDIPERLVKEKIYKKLEKNPEDACAEEYKKLDEISDTRTALEQLLALTVAIYSTNKKPNECELLDDVITKLSDLEVQLQHFRNELMEYSEYIFYDIAKEFKKTTKKRKVKKLLKNQKQAKKAYEYALKEMSKYSKKSFNKKQKKFVKICTENEIRLYLARYNFSYSKLKNKQIIKLLQEKTDYCLNLHKKMNFDDYVKLHNLQTKIEHTKNTLKKPFSLSREEIVKNFDVVPDSYLEKLQNDAIWLLEVLQGKCVADKVKEALNKGPCKYAMRLTRVAPGLSVPLLLPVSGNCEAIQSYEWGKIEPMNECENSPRPFQDRIDKIKEKAKTRKASDKIKKLCQTIK